MKSLFNLLVFLSFCTYSVAQRYSFQNLNKLDGLSNNFVTDIVQDRQGFIWIATEDGLNRFDGQNFTIYNTLNSDLHNNAINALLYDEQEDLLWIGTRAYLSILNCSTLKFENYEELNGVPFVNIIHISHGTGNNIWITNRDRGIVCYNRREKKATPYNSETVKGLPNMNLCSYEDGKGNLYIGHNQHGLSIIHLHDNTYKRFRHDPQNKKSLPGDKVYSIKGDSQGNIWLGTDHGLALFNPRKDEFITFRHEADKPSSLAGNRIYDINEMNDGTLWFLADVSGISILDLYELNYAHPESVRFTNLTPTDDEYSPTPGNIRSLLQDSFGNTWIGNGRNGLDFISHTPHTFRMLPYKKGKDFRTVWSIYTDHKQQIWVGSEKEIALFENNLLKKSIDISSYAGDLLTPVSAIKESTSGNIFFGIKDVGLIIYNVSSKTFRHISSDSDISDIMTFFEDAEKMWIGTQNGIYTYTNGKLENQIEINNQLTTKSIYGVYRNKQGKLWVGTFGAGVFVFDKNNKLIKHLYLGNNFFSNAISCIYADSQEGLWIASRNAGIAYIPDTDNLENIEYYGVEQGLNDLYVRAFQEDHTGNVWFSTNSGISVLNKESQSIHNYDYHDGIPIDIFIENAASSTQSGTIYFGSLGGICYFEPEEVMRKHQVAPVQIIECRVFNTQITSEGDFLVPVNENINLEYYQNSFRISFSVPDYTQSRQVEYAYMIEGLQNIWLNTRGDNQVTLRNVPPGNYDFRVKARLKNQDWEEKHIASIKIRIHPPLWLTWYAKLFYFAIISLTVIALIKSYKRKLKLQNSLELERKNIQNEQNLNQERLRFYTNITHELRTPLTLILGPLEDLVNDKDLPSQYSKIISTIHKSTLRLLNLINQILEFRKTETQNRKLTVAKGDIANLVTEIGLRYKELNKNPNLRFQIIIKTTDSTIYFDADIIATILNNLLSNAVKYTSEGEISLLLESINKSEHEYIQIKVSDTGCGIAPDAIPHIFDRYYQAKGKYQTSGTGIGLALVKSLVSIHEGFLNVESDLDQGTTFTFLLSAHNTYPNALHKETKPSISIEVNKDIEENESVQSVQPLLLIVEDNDDIREYIHTSLSSEYKVIEGKNGNEGVELATNHIPDIVVSDIMMPEMNGIEFCRIIKEDVRTSHIPVILLTAKDSIQDKEEGYESGADSYLTKPFSAKLLRARIQNLLESRKKLAHQITTNAQEVQPTQELLKMSKLDEIFLAKLTKFIEDNLSDEALDIPRTTQEMNMSHSTFYRKVKGLTGISPSEFINKVRLKNCIKLLLSGDYNVSEVAYMTGFNNLGYFRKCFKEEYGMTPSEYIKKKSL